VKHCKVRLHRYLQILKGCQGSTVEHILPDCHDEDDKNLKRWHQFFYKTTQGYDWSSRIYRTLQTNYSSTCATVCLLNPDTCQLFVYQSKTRTCSLGNFDLVTPSVGTNETVYIKKGKLLCF